jgi:hypothetical protein
MGRAAKFYGSCQACGNRHKLPSGVLSKHGYKVIWNSFWNVCPGEGRAAFEESKDLVEELISSVNAQVENLEERSAAVADEDFVVLKAKPDYRYSGRRRCPDLKKNVPISELRYERASIEWNDPDDDDRLYSYTAWSPDGPEGQVEDAKKKRREEFGYEIRGAKDYIKWQEGRIENWEPKALEPIAPPKPDPVRTYYEDRTDCYRRERELKEAGNKVRTRRDQYGGGCTLFDYGKEEAA